MWHKAVWMGHPMRLELTRDGSPGSGCRFYFLPIKGFNYFVRSLESEF